jgi:hypothetical protein
MTIFFFTGAKTRPQFGQFGKSIKLVLLARRKVELDNPVPVGRISELEAEYRGVIFGLLQSIASQSVCRLRFHHREHEVPCIAQEIISAFTGPAASPRTHGNYAAVSEAFLLADLIVVPAGGVKLRQNVFSTGVGFVDHTRALRSRFAIISARFYAISGRRRKAKPCGISDLKWQMTGRSGLRPPFGISDLKFK